MTFPETGPLNKGPYSEFLGILKPFEEQIRDESDESARHAMVDALEAHFERFGWTPSGLKKARRDKQKQKRSEALEALRKGL